MCNIRSWQYELSTVHRRWKGEGKGKKVNRKTPRDLGPADTTMHTREEGQYSYVKTVRWQVGGLMVIIL